MVNGLTGRIEFNEGKRSNFKLDLLKLKKEELRKVGHWTPSEGINITDSTAFYESSATNITLVVMTREVCYTYLLQALPWLTHSHTNSLMHAEPKPIGLGTLNLA